MPSTPTLSELRSVAEREGVSPSDADLEAVQAFLDILLPQFDELEQLLAAEDEP
jgi:HPt (histidine-containing phosphotransfer) domain-containing protein